jgi:mono/diheme cytochrome c family protein
MAAASGGNLQGLEEMATMTDGRVALAFALALGVAACGGGNDSPPAAAGTPPAASGVAPVLADGATAEMVAQGGELFRGNGNCHACHAQDGSGTALAPTLRDDTWLNTDGTFEGIQNVIRTGVMQPVQYPAPMPPMGGVQLTDDQVVSLAAYVYSISRGG